MINVNGYKINLNRFPDGTLCMLDFPKFKALMRLDSRILVEWYYDNDYELVALQYVMAHLRDNYPLCKNYVLFMPYIPNARMDRIDPVEKKQQVFTLKAFASIINSLNFDAVYVFDPHSTVSMALIDKIHEIPIKPIISAVIEDIKKDEPDSDMVIYTPDAGAYKRYSGLLKSLGVPFVYGEKKRDFATGKIEGLRVITNGLDLKGKTVLMIDDIIAYGGTFYYSAQELKNLGVENIYAYASHTENSILEMDTSKETPELKSKFLKMIYQGEVKRLLTTNTIFRQSTTEHINVREFNSSYCYMVLYDDDYVVK